MDLHPVLEDDRIIAKPLTADDFKALYSVASDPAIWKQHPNKNRYEMNVFKTFFEGALKSGGAYIIYDKQSGDPIGGSRFYNYNEKDKSIFIGYTFYAPKCWGTGINHRMKRLMMKYAFTFVDKVIFHVGAVNYPSQKSIEKLGVKKVREEEVAYYGEPSRLNFVYEMTKDEFQHTLAKQKSG